MRERIHRSEALTDEELLPGFAPPLTRVYSAPPKARS